MRRLRVKVVNDPVEYCRRVDGPDDEIVRSGVPLLGYFDHHRNLIVLKRGRPRKMASTLFHEHTHRLLPKLSEEDVVRLEDGLFPLLWKHGFRPFG